MATPISKQTDDVAFRYFIRLAYNGAPFHGWQVQPNATTVQSVVEGAKLAAFIDDAVVDSIKELEQWQCVGKREIDSLKNIKGKVFIQSMSVDVIQFVADAYRCLKY